jgi:hypothetical protein
MHWIRMSMIGICGTQGILDTVGVIMLADMV